jgi:DNA-binding transcriptional ArsR family regulator
MVVDSLDQTQVDLMFHALADATRRDILTRVLVGESSVSDLARKYAMSFAAVQKHVAVLERAQIVTKERRGREQLVRAKIDTVRRASLVLDQFEVIWRSRIERFGELLASPVSSQPKPTRPKSI